MGDTKPEPKKKGIFRYRNIMLVLIAFIVVGSIATPILEGQREEKAEAASSAAPIEYGKVDDITAAKVRQACEDRINELHTQGQLQVDRMFWSGSVNKVDALKGKISYNIDFTIENADGTTIDKTCYVINDFSSVEVKRKTS
ncbi:hypothetical protein SAMN04489740_0207 [Arthrobacter alpinus]|uniref:Uncharacterized protein n=1 Tax=Arthrobacter alpinus TaxID=656366 RepID=A0A1H5ECG0_9MICC|nr:hypothetical protein [Arthrobacter alpinus]SED88726.1 hypothetical protein SAMN04489740_0207 [Arthrobacter alpinus]